MGTRGLFAYRYRGVYYIKYNHFDSYPEVLGYDLVSRIPSNLEKFQRWLEMARKGIACFIDQIESKDVIDQDFYGGLSRSDFEESSGPPKNDLFIEWTYVYDLDNLAFIVQGTAAFSMTSMVHISRKRFGKAWIKELVLDRSNMYCVSPFAPVEYRPVVSASPLSDRQLEDLQLFEKTKINRIEPSIWMDASDSEELRLSREVAMMASEGLISGAYSSYGSSFKDFGKPIFKALAMELVKYASPASEVFSYDPKVDRSLALEKIRSYAENEHIQNADPLIWYRGCMVVLVKTLRDADTFNSSVGMIIRRVKELNLENCTALLLSIDHVAVVVISGESVSCSEAVGVVSAYGADYEELQRGLRLMAHFLPPPCCPSSSSFSGEARLTLDSMIRIMELADAGTRLTVGRTCKTLRVEWLKRPTVGPYTLRSSLGNNKFIAKRLDDVESEDGVTVTMKTVKLSILLPALTYTEGSRSDSHPCNEAFMHHCFDCQYKLIGVDDETHDIFQRPAFYHVHLLCYGYEYGHFLHSCLFRTLTY